METKSKNKEENAQEVIFQNSPISLKQCNYPSDALPKYYIYNAKMARQNNETYRAQILNCREIKGIQKENSKDTTFNFEYYVHYIGYNRRLDE